MLECLSHSLEMGGRLLRAAALFAAAQALFLTPLLGEEVLLAGLVFFTATLPLVVAGAYALAGRDAPYRELVVRGLALLLASVAAALVLSLLILLLALLFPPLALYGESLSNILLYAYTNVLLARTAEVESLRELPRAALRLKGMGFALATALLAFIAFTPTPQSPMALALAILGDGLLRAAAVACALKR